MSSFPTQLEDNLNDLERATSILKMAPVSYDLTTSICGEFIGSGVYRSVFEYNLDNRYVVKIEPLATDCNKIEAMIWNEVVGLKGPLEWVTKWFAPVKWVSPNGRILVMRKTSPEPPRDCTRPEKVPKFLWDVKPDNFGWIGKNFVCHDYGQFYNMIHYQKGMKKANWKW